MLLRKKIFDDDQNLFNPIFGRTGGEDVDFFRRMMEKGYEFVWCDEASVYETVPVERFDKKYYLRRALLRGKVSLKHPSLRTKTYQVIKSCIAFIVYSLSLPFLYISGEHLFMKYLIRYFDHIGRILSLVDLNRIKERT